MHAKSFLNEFWGNGDMPVRRVPEEKNAVKADKWDREDYNAILSEMKELEVSVDQLSRVVETGAPAMADEFFSLAKAVPKLKDEKDMRPSHLVNRAVMGEAMELKEYNELRIHTSGDVVAAGLGTIAMEPELEVLFDKLKSMQDLADELQQQMEAAQGVADGIKSLDDMIAEALAAGASDGDSEVKDMQEQQAAAKQALEKMKKEMDATAEQMDSEWDSKLPELKETMKSAYGEANDQAEQMDNLPSWGLDPGELQRLPAQRRLELAKQFNNEKFRKIAKLLGPLKRMAFGEQKKKVTNASEEIFNVKTGNDLPRVLPTEMLMLGDDDMCIDFFRRFTEESLLQYEMRGTEKICKGDVIFCEDGSGSMYGDREVWAKAVGLALLQVSHSQKRGFYGIHFGSPGEYMTFEFAPDGSVDTFHKGAKKHLSKLDGTILFAETFFNGGTDFHTPLTVALDRLRAQYEATGAVKADIVFVTDGQCSVSDDWMKAFKEEQARIGFRVWGVIIGATYGTEPLNTICDGRVFTITNLLNGDEIKDIFKGV